MGSAFCGEEVKPTWFALFPPQPSTTEAKALPVLLVARAQHPHQDGMLHLVSRVHSVIAGDKNCHLPGMPGYVTSKLPPLPTASAFTHTHHGVCCVYLACACPCSCRESCAGNVAPAREHAGLPVTFLHGLWIWRSSWPVRSMLANTRWSCTSCRISVRAL